MKPSKLILLLSVAVTGLFSLSQARADLESQYFYTGQSFAAFTLGDVYGNGLGNSLVTGSSSIYGDVGVGGYGQTFTVDSTDTFYNTNNYPTTANINTGNIYYNAGASSSVSGTPTGGAKYGGQAPGGNVVAGNTATMNSQEAELLASSTTFAAMSFSGTSSVTSSNTNTRSNGFLPGTTSNITLSGTGTAGNLTLAATGSMADHIVLKLSNVTLAAGSTLTLAGNGNANTSFVLDITAGFYVSNSTIKLTGGLTAGNVVFNLIGNSPAGSGDTATPNSNYYTLLNSTVSGSILATQRTIELNNSSLDGTAAGERLVMLNNSTITQDPASP